MAAPSVSDIRSWSKVDWAPLGYAQDDPDPLERLLAVALSTLTRYTGQSWDGDTYSDLAPAKGTEAMAQDAVQVLVEMAAFKKQGDRLETFQDFDLLNNFSAGGYSESRRNGKDMQDATYGMLKSILWPLMSYDAQDEWIQMTTGVVAPAFTTTEVAWDRAGALGLTAFDPYVVP